MSSYSEVGEALDILEGPNEDSARSLSRVKVMAGLLGIGRPGGLSIKEHTHDLGQERREGRLGNRQRKLVSRLSPQDLGD